MNTILITGATGGVGGPLVAAILEARIARRVVALMRPPLDPRASRLLSYLRDEGVDTTALQVVAGDLSDPACAFASTPAPDVILHCAASTQFRSSFEDLSAVNVAGTSRLLAWAESLPRAPRFVHFSTLCVAGRNAGTVSETPITSSPDFVNPYEHSKWIAEGCVLSSALPVEIVRLGIVAGRERDGQTYRRGALHAAMRWLRRGLLPIVPGVSDARLELVSTDLVAQFILRLLAQPTSRGAIYHVGAGDDALGIGDFLDVAAGVMREIDPRWRDEQVLPPVVALRPAFELFRASVVKSRDMLFNEVVASADSFLPILLHPKRFLSERAERVWGGPLRRLPAREFAARVITASQIETATALPSKHAA